MLISNEKGQSLIEVLVVGIVSAIMILALIMIILNSLKNAQFAQNQIQATKYAQDTIDKIRVLRDDNGYTIGSSCFIELFNTLSGAPFKCGAGKYCYYNLLNNVTLNFLGNTDTVSLPATNINILGSVFTKQIKVSQTSADEANITVTVNWSDSSGSHSSQLETILTKPNYDCTN